MTFEEIKIISDGRLKRRKNWPNQLTEEAFEAEIFQFRTLLDDDVADAAEAGDDFKGESRVVDGLQVIPVLDERLALTGPRVNRSAQDEQMEKEDPEPLEELHPGERLPLLFQQPLDDSAVQHVQMLLFRSVEDDHQGGI